MPGIRDTFQCSFSACRFGFRKCWRWVQCHKPLVFVLRDQYNVLCLGLTGAGKSTILAQLVGEAHSHLEPTNGFNIKTLPVNDTVISIKELGGSCRIQPFWECYFNEKNAILFVVNAAASEDELKTSRDILKKVLCDVRLKSKPCLIIGTHIDVSEARSESDLTNFFQPILHGHKYWRVICVSAFDRKQIVAALEALIELMLINQ